LYSSLLLLCGIIEGGGCGYSMQRALGRTGDVFMLLEIYILKISTVSFWHGI
jgi:hypothetical protein